MSSWRTHQPKDILGDFKVRRHRLAYYLKSDVVADLVGAVAVRQLQ